METISRHLGRLRDRNPKDACVLPVYESLSEVTLTAAHKSSERFSEETELPSGDDSDTCTVSSQNQLYSDETTSKSQRNTSSLPSLRSFLADFTLGFADGLTVPFALTAGLSSLGDTSTVIFAGMAEIVAGSISMGIGGYLAARGEIVASRRAEKEQNAAASAASDADGNEESPLRGGDEEQNEKLNMSSADSGESHTVTMATIKYLAPLGLPHHLEAAVLAHITQHVYNGGAMPELSTRSDNERPSSSMSAVWSGLSVSLGYLLGGSLPLFPYFFVSGVEDGLLWSFLVCVVALFAFGFTKDFVLNNEESRHVGGSDGAEGKKIDWPRIKSGCWEGLQMVILGSIAALAAVLCVKLFAGLI
ncbi:VIT family-domain-containing protein [Cercophora scortea]|uniref:VIT family-domain-containing protein n=1 Tax=Cercophora scortea TaxID=314031 RepID=A0AAE0IA15_9PEZI|nr:VIT family-domain-containing protein [Cercophora scortea]